MNTPFFFQENLELHSDVIELGEETSRHIVQVLRMKPGERIMLTNGKGRMMLTEIEDDHKKKCRVRRTELTFVEASNRKITIAISPVKNTSRFEWFLEKATEMGVHAIIPMLCKRTEKQHFRKDRMQNILVSAMLQSKQSYLPELHEPVQFNDVLEAYKEKTSCIAHCEDGKIRNHFRSYCQENQMLILIGPEGDFTPEEIEAALAKDVKPVSLGDTRLRTETAGIAAAALFCL